MLCVVHAHKVSFKTKKEKSEKDLPLFSLYLLTVNNKWSVVCVSVLAVPSVCVMAVSKLLSSSQSSVKLIGLSQSQWVTPAQPLVQRYLEAGGARERNSC